MAIAKMKLVNIVGRLKNFDSVVRGCCIEGNFHPEQSSLAIGDYEEFIPIDEINPYGQSLHKAVDIAVHSGIKLLYSDFEKLSMSDKDLENYVAHTESTVNGLNERIRNIISTNAHLEQGIQQLQHFIGFGISLDELFSTKFIHFHFGRLPKDSYPKLDLYEDSLFFFPQEEENEYYWGFYAAPIKDCEKIDEFFDSLYFERISLIEEAHGTPQEAIKTISEQITKLREEQKDLEKQAELFWQKETDKFLRVYSRLKYLHDSFELRKYAVKCKGSFYIFGWVPEDQVEPFIKRFEKFDNVDCVIEEPEAAETIEPPTKLINKKIFKPFETFIDMYGLPAYNEIDPTPFLAFTYTLFYGIMFGDLGQGAVILLIGLYLLHKKNGFGGILARIGGASMLFGALYNSVFGYEDILPVTVLPVHNAAYTQFVLFGTMGFGIVMILICMCINIVNGIRQKNIEKIWFSHNGISGFVFYGSVVLAGVLTALFNMKIISPLFIVLLIVLPLLLIFLKDPLTLLFEHNKSWMPENKFEFFLQNFFEMFEVLLSYVTNTISFMRIGAFVISHAGMMAAFITLANMNMVGFPIITLIGNVVVIGLEGLIVGIQGIRLQFYEIFSRFYEGSGKPYDPVKIKY